jgi:aminoglycoside phosphotransferase (APT) family kinase protein
VANSPRSTEDLRRRLIAAQFPDLAPVTVTYLGEGYDSTAFDVNGTWVFRFPKRADVEQQQLIEQRVLPVLGRHLPLPIPSPRFLGQPTGEFARHFIGYAKIPGLPGIHFDRSRFAFAAAADPLGRFLSSLHAFPAADARRLGVPDQQIDTVIDESRTEALDGFHLVRELAPDAPLGHWHAYLSAGPPRHSARSSSPVLLHNDLAAEHVLCDERTGLPTGVIDWSDMALGDPAADFAGILHWGGEPFAKALLAHYDGQVNEHCLARARYLAACRGVGDVRFGLDMNRREYITAGIRALEMCASKQ